MRTVSATLEAAQTASSRVPYFSCIFKRNVSGTTIANYSCAGKPNDSTARILYFRIHEFAYSSGDSGSPSIIVLRNNDRAVVDLRGCYVDFGIGDVTVGGNEYSTLPRMWVKHQEIVSSPGGIFTTLILEGAWEALEEEHTRLDDSIDDPALYYLVNRTTTPYDLMANILDPAYSYMAFTLDALTVDDGIIDTFLPYFEINAGRNRYESKLETLYRLISMTACYIKPLASNHLEIIYPLPTDDTDLTITTFYEFHERQNEVLPNTIWVFANDTGSDETGGHYNWPSLEIGIAVDSNALTRYGEIEIKEHYLCPTILTEVDADNRALAIMAKKQAEELSQSFVMPHDCRIELYDYLEVIDTRL